MDSVVLVTGATGGIGGAIVRALCAAGARVVFSGRSPERLALIGEEIAASGAEALGIPCDLLEPGAPRSLVERAAAWGNGLQGIVSCAGGARFTFFTRLTAADFDDAIRLNFGCAVELTRAALPHLFAAKRSWLVLVNTIAAREPAPPRGSSYLAAKAALLHFADCLFAENRDQGLSVTSILPDLTDTPLVPGALGHDRATLMRPESVANAVLFAMSGSPDACCTEIHLRPQPSLRHKEPHGHAGH